MTKRLVAVNERGLRVGEDSPQAKLTNEEVERMRVLHETEALGYKRLARMFEVSPSQVRNICKYINRPVTAARLVAVG